MKSLLVKITDKYGRALETKASVAANGTISFGSKYVPGVYTVEIIQGKIKRSLRLIKQ
jgi:hypothetical protein